MKFDFGYISKMYIGSFTKCKSEIPINTCISNFTERKSAPIFVFLVISTNKIYHGIEKSQIKFLVEFLCENYPERR